MNCCNPILTEHEIQVEMAYRYQERLGMLCEDREPDIEQIALATDESEQWGDDARHGRHWRVQVKERMRKYQDKVAPRSQRMVKGQ